MSQNTLAEYRNLYRDRHGIECPLSDAQIRDAMATATVGEDVWPLSLDVLTEMEALVTSEFPGVNQSRWMHGGTLDNIVLTQTTGTISTVELDFDLLEGGNPPYSYQLQQAPDVTGSPGTYVNEGAAQEDNTTIELDTLAAILWWRIVATDNLDETVTSNEVRFLRAPDDLAADNPTATTVDVNWSVATGGVAPFSYQVQVAPDDTGAPGTWADFGTAQEDNTEVVVTGLTTMTTYWFRVIVTDDAGSVSVSNTDSQATS